MNWLMMYLLAINAAGFLLFGEDKRRAIRGAWRIRESVLMTFALLGGGAGCLAGMYCFHHKTRHTLFRVGIPLILILECILGVFFYFYS